MDGYDINPNMFDGGGFTGATDIVSGGAVTDPSGNPSNGLDYNGLLSQLIGTAGGAYSANQINQAAQANARLYGGSFLSNPMAFLSSGQGKQWLIIGAGILALALILRR